VTEELLPVITDPDPTAVMAELARSGAVLVRADAVSHEDFIGLGDALMAPMSRAWPGGEREPVAGDPTTTTVTRGRYGMPLHREASYAPYPPSLLMFRCERSARHGGETTLCDGVALLRALPDQVRRFVTGRELYWETHWADAAWQAAWRTTDPGAAERAVRDWAARLPPGEALSVAFTPGGMTLRYWTSCTPPALFDSAPAFCNSLLILAAGTDDYYVETGLRARLTDGSPFPADVLAEVGEVAAGTAIDVAWRPGDILVINNTRVMHGRRPFRGDRRVLVRMGYIRPEWIARLGGTT
jgi:alpha-ketoglutarate-dependent taurine dioxygenase